ncbi:hypothetical protein F891_00885 [Acinetobacter sp. CIP 101966]|uniref:hypothetical protein n=1 Tax=Acinetobacter sp. CIP 101966 TaxID=1144662 RepID=UPI0002D11BF3|nr:hypothetical protein [Acinetobacter sp. CIP 101966]ENX28968.1 hypothetical protein F891_00885 [Acinetobacter sp. CIP 101966]
MVGLVKHYANTMKGIPQLTNNWGAMITLLDAVLVNGFNHVPVISVSKSTPTAITATINLGSGHGFIDRQVVRIAGSINGWDGDYKVLSVDGASITVECTSDHPIVILGTATCFTAPLDFEIVYQTHAISTEPKRAYRSTDPESLGLILLVHDFCVSGALVTGAKFAKVGITENVDSNGNAVGNFMPFSAENINENWEWDGTHHGRAKWYYAAADYLSTSYSYTDRDNSSNTNRGFTIVGDGSSFAITIVNNNTPYLYGVFEFFDCEIQGRNLLFSAANINSRIAQNTSVSITSRCGLCAGFFEGDASQRGLLWYDEQAIRQDKTLTRAVMLGFMSASVQPAAITTNSPVFMQMPIVDSSFKLRGVVPFVRLQFGQITGDRYTDDGLVRSYNHSAGANGYVNFGLSLEMQ